MKRSSKILALVFAMAIVFSAFVFSFSASAEAGTGYVSKATDFQNVGAGIMASEKANKTVTATDGSKHTFNYSGRVGNATACVTEQDGNVYVLMDNVSSVDKGTTSYLSTAIDGNAEIKDNQLKVTNDVSSFSFYSYDIDVMIPMGQKVMEGSNINFEFRYIPAGKTGRDFYYGSWNNIVRFRNDGDNVYAAVGSSIIDEEGNVDGDIVYLEKGVWAHITAIVEVKSFTAENMDIDTHVYINGEYVGTRSGVTVTDPAKYYGNTVHAALVEVRVNPTGKSNDGGVLAFDNINARSYKNDYSNKEQLTSVLAAKTDLSNWDDSLYNKDAMPFGQVGYTIGEVGFDTFEKAVAAAEAGDTIKVLKPSPNATVIDKAITVDATYEGGVYEVNLVTGKGFAPTVDVEGVYVFKEAQNVEVAVEFDPCFCEDYDPDNTELHPFYCLVDVTLGNKILDAYEGANYERWQKVDAEGRITTVKGWNYVDYDGNVIGPVGKDDVVTEEILAEEWISIAPVYETVLPTYEIVSGGQVIKTLGDVSFGEAVKQTYLAGKSNITLKLLRNITVDKFADAANQSTIEGQTKIYESSNNTIDINGFTVTVNDKYLIKMDGHSTLTITSSKVGGKIVMDPTLDATKNSVIHTTNYNTYFKIIGADSKGNNTLSVYAPALILTSSGRASDITITGGEYYRLATNTTGAFINIGSLNGSKAPSKTSTITNALFVDRGIATLEIPGSRDPRKEGAKLAIDNCTFITCNFAKMIANNAPITFTNTKILGNIAPTSTYDTKVNSAYRTLGVITLGNGTYVSGEMSENVVVAEGMQMYKAASKVTVNTGLAADVASSVYYTKYFVTTAGLTPVTITWQDAAGNVLATTTEHVKGMVPNYNYITGEAVKGWLVKGMNDWADVAVLGDETEKVIKLKDTATETLIAQVDLKFNIALSSHLTSNLYIPEILDGITMTNGLMLYVNMLRSSSAISGEFVINGNKYTKTSAWPGATAYDSGAVVITFTYEGNAYTVATYMNAVKYCKYLLDEANGYNDEAKTLAANALNYMVVTSEYNHRDVTYYKPVLEANAKYLISIDPATCKKADMSEISKYISGVKMTISNMGPAFQFTKTEAGKAAGVSITIKGIGFTDKTTYLQTANNTNIAYVAGTHTIEVVDGENTYTATFTLENYIALCQEANQTDVVNLLVSIYGYAKADADYWFNPAYKPQA